MPGASPRREGEGAAGEALPGGPAAGQRRLRLGVLRYPPLRQRPGGHQTRGPGPHLRVGRAARRHPRADGDPAAEEGGLGLPRGHPPPRLVRASRQLRAGAGAAGPGAGPLRFHHGARRPARGAGAGALPPGAGGRAALPQLRRPAPRHQGREHPHRPLHRRAQAHRLRLRRPPQGHRLHRFRRYSGVQPAGVDPLPPLPRALGGRVVAGRAALRHGVRGHPLRAGRGDPAGPGVLQAEGLSRVPAPHQVVLVPAPLGQAVLRRHLQPLLDAKRPPPPEGHGDPPAQFAPGDGQITAPCLSWP